MGRDVWCYCLIQYSIKLLKIHICCLQMYKINFEDGNHSCLRSIWDCCSFTDLGLNKTKSTVLGTPSLLQAGNSCSGASGVPERLDKSRLHRHILSLSNRFEKTFQVKFCFPQCRLVSPTQECYKNSLRNHTMELYKLQQVSKKVALMINKNKCWQN